MTRRGSWRIGTRLFVAQVIVLLAISISAGLVASAIGPRLFHEHLIEAGEKETSPQFSHIEAAFESANIISLSIGLVIALAAALMITWYLARRFSTPLTDLTDTATRLSSGDLSARATAAGGVPEFALLATSLSDMAERLENTEATRRRLLSNLAHEMRTPVATLNAYLEGVSDGVLGWDDDTRHVLERQAERLTRLARDLDDVSRAEEGRVSLDLSVHSLQTLIESSVSQFGPQFESKSVQLSVQVSAGLVRVDPQRFAQILANLLNNALRHTPRGGIVSITADRSADDISVAVSDNGEGMTSEELGQAFERFYRGSTARAEDKNGSGIGLTISRALAEAHGGTLTATSGGRGCGATFTLSLPSPHTTSSLRGSESLGTRHPHRTHGSTR